MCSIRDTHSCPQALRDVSKTVLLHSRAINIGKQALWREMKGTMIGDWIREEILLQFTTHEELRSYELTR